jgi:hypothetical protein
MGPAPVDRDRLARSARPDASLAKQHCERHGIMFKITWPETDPAAARVVAPGLEGQQPVHVAYRSKHVQFSAARRDHVVLWRWLLPLLIALLAIWLLSKVLDAVRCLPSRRHRRPAAAEAAPQRHRSNPHRPIPPPSCDAPAATLYFDVGSADLPADSTGGLEPVVAYLKANPSTTAVVSGYHDPSGDAAATRSSPGTAHSRAECARRRRRRGRADRPRETGRNDGDWLADDARRVEVTVR